MRKRFNYHHIFWKNEINSLNINYFYLLNTKILHSNAYKFKSFFFLSQIWYQAQPRPTKQARPENGTTDAQGMPHTLIINNAPMYPAGVPTNLPPNYNAHFVTTTTTISGDVIKPQVGVEYTIASPAIGTVANSESQSTTSNFVTSLGRSS